MIVHDKCKLFLQNKEIDFQRNKDVVTVKRARLYGAVVIFLLLIIIIAPFT